MEILNLTSESIFPSKDLPFYIGKYYHTNFSDLKIHTHDFIEIVYVYDGKGYHIYNDVTYPVSKGELYIINSRTPHCFYPTDKSNSEHLVVYNLCFLPEFISSINIHLPILVELTDIMLYKSLYPDEIIYSPDLKLSGSMRTEIDSSMKKCTWNLLPKASIMWSFSVFPSVSFFSRFTVFTGKTTPHRKAR